MGLIRMSVSKLALAALAAVVACAMAFSAPSGSKGSELSQSRLQTIQRIIAGYQKAGEKLSDPDVQKLIFNDISKAMPLVPKEKPDVRDTKRLSDAVGDIVAKKFPESADVLQRKAEKVADDKFVMHSLLDYVSVRSQKGDDYYSNEGVFYGYGGNSIKVGDRYIAIFDLLPEYRIKFDKAYNEQKRKEFIDGCVQDYFAKKNQYSNEVFKKLRDEQSRRNEELGYINAWREWRSARNIAEILIATEMSKVKGGAGKTPDEMLNLPPNVDSQQDDTPLVEATPAPKPPDPDSAKKGNLEELMKKVKKRLGDIANSCSGIDADQGYKMALWGFTREEVGLILSSEGIAISPAKASDVIVPKDGPTKKIELQYQGSYLVRVNVWFNVTDPKGFIALCGKLVETYGRTDEERKALQEAEARVDSAEKADDKKDKKDDKKDDKKKDEKKDDKKDDKKKDEKKKELPPIEQSYHWTGKTTSGTIYIKLNQERTAAEEVRLTKECPALIQSIMDEEKRLKEEEARNKKKPGTIDYKKIDF